MHRKVKAFIDEFREKASEKNALVLLENFNNELIIRSFEKIIEDPRQKPLTEKLGPKVVVTVLNYMSRLPKNGMGLWPFSSDEISDYDLGLKIAMAYGDEAGKYSESKYRSGDEFVEYAVSKIPDYLETIGSLVKANVASISQSDAIEGVIRLAKRSKGQASLPQVVTAAGGHGDTINLWQAVPEIATETAKDIVEETSEVVQAVGTGALATLKLTKYLPIILGIGGAIYFFGDKLFKKRRG